MRTPTLPFGRKAPWILAAVALGLIAFGLFTRDREMLVVGGVAAAAWLLAFPVASTIVGKGDGEDT